MKSFGVQCFGLLAVASVAMSASVLSPEIFTEWEGRIVGGAVASPGQFPHQISVRSGGNAHVCSGWIHNNRWVVSAASCTLGRTVANTRVVVGAHSRTDGTSMPSFSIRSHPNYNINTQANDISAIQTALGIVTNDRVQPIPLGINEVGEVAATISGWGKTDVGGYFSRATKDFLL